MIFRIYNIGCHLAMNKKKHVKKPIKHKKNTLKTKRMHITHFKVQIEKKAIRQ